MALFTALVISAGLLLAVPASAASAYSLVSSPIKDRSSPSPLDGKTVSGSLYAFVTPTSGIDQVRFFIDDPSASGAPYRTENIAAYDLGGTETDGTARPFNTGTLAKGDHTITAAVDKIGGGTDLLTATITVGSSSSNCSPVACDQIKVPTPYALDFRGGDGGIPDNSNVGTGFTTYLRTGSGDGYRPNKLTIDPDLSGQLAIDTTVGQVNTSQNAQVNMLGVGFDGGTGTVIQSSLASLPSATGNFEQAGVWFGYSQDEVARVALASAGSGTWRFEFSVETGGVRTAVASTGSRTISAGTPVFMRITTDPVNRTASASYRVGSSGAYTSFGPTAPVPGEFFSFDAAGIDPEIGTRSFAGVYASGRTAVPLPTFRFSSFSLAKSAVQPPSGSTKFGFDRTHYPLSSRPTAITTGPDGKIYLTTLGGDVRILTLGAGGTITNDRTVTTLGNRLALGIAVDPASTPSNVIIWVAHSSPGSTNGVLNSGTVTRLSGTGLSTKTDVITGLPRSIANHSVNGLKFGPDGRLYIASGGNTGAGAANTATTEFGTRAEQPLSAGVIVADVKATGFDGTCANNNDYTGPAPCDVTPWATGLRNTYDIVWHSNGYMYGPDNGLGVTGSFPPSPNPPCTGFGSTTSWTNGGDNPGDQPDELNLIEEGRYYGHPNPSLDLCRFGDGHYQNVAPEPNYTAPLKNVGTNTSTNGIVEYRGQSFCGALNHNLLMTNYSVGDDITRVVLSANGRRVKSMRSLVGGFSDPLPLAQTADGRLLVGEFGSEQLTILTPRDNCWTSGKALPAPRLDAGGAAIGDSLYVVGGKDSSGHLNSLLRYNEGSNTWAALADKPGTPVENSAVASYNGQVYVAGGATGPFSGAVAEARVYDPATNIWSTLPSLGTARSGAGAAIVGSTLYVVGGMSASGASLDSVETLDLANTQSGWQSAPNLQTRRDNPGVVAIGNTVYAFGGRTRLADGTTVQGTLASTEALVSGATGWVTKAPMPTGRRGMAAVSYQGQAYLVGGEANGSAAFTENERYDPSSNTWKTLAPLSQGRHGAAAGVLNGAVHLAGGGVVAGTSFSALHSVYTP